MLLLVGRSRVGCCCSAPDVLARWSARIKSKGRTREGKEIARTKDGYKEGRPKKFTKEQIDLALSMLSVNCGDKSYNEVERLMGISVSTLKRENNKRKLDKINN